MILSLLNVKALMVAYSDQYPSATPLNSTDELCHLIGWCISTSSLRSVLDERERCAKIVEARGMFGMDGDDVVDYYHPAKEIIEAIRNLNCAESSAASEGESNG